MIPEDFINEWSLYAPWNSLAMVEQDLIISRALLNLYEGSQVKNALVFRGGTALNKIYIKPPARYSEDLDFVQIIAAGIGPVIDEIRTSLNWLGEPKVKRTERSVKLVYRYQSIEGLQRKLKIEINTTEHFHCLDLVEQKFSVKNSWFSGDAVIKTYQLEELMGTKLRALYQRAKGRDLFDVWFLILENNLDIQKVIEVFQFYMEKNGCTISRFLFEKNIDEKLKDHKFIDDIGPLLLPDLMAKHSKLMITDKSELIMTESGANLETSGWNLFDVAQEIKDKILKYLP